MGDFARGLRDSLVVIVLTFLLMAMVTFVAGGAVAGAFVCGVPMAYLGAKHKLKFTIPTLVIVYAIIFAVTANWILSLWIVAMMVLPGTVAGFMLGERKPFFAVLMAVCATSAVGWLLAFLLVNLGVEGGVAGFIDSLAPQIEETFMQSFEQMKGIGMDAEIRKIMPAVPEMVNMSLAVTKLYLPTVVAVISAISGYAVVRICGFALRVSRVANGDILPFSMLRAPRSMSIVAVLCYLISFFASTQDAFGGVVSNVAAVLEFFLGVCGLSFIDHLLKKGIRVAFLRWLIYSGVLVLLFVTMAFPVVSYGLVILGILDAGRDFRRIGEYPEIEF